MSLLPQELGEQIQGNLPIAPRDFSGPDLFQAERWLLENGLISETSADTLVMYGWMAPNVKAVELRIDLDLETQAGPLRYNTRSGFHGSTTCLRG